MNLITKFAYNALTKTIQAIAPGGVALGVPSLTNIGEQKTLSITNPMGSGSITVYRAVGFKYLSGGAWRLRFNISVISSGISNNNFYKIALSGVTFKSITGFRQPVAWKRDSGLSSTGVEQAFANFGGSEVVIGWLTSNSDVNGSWAFSGDVECESEPTI